MAEKRFQDKVVLVTGGSSGIGRATARAFAREGASVVIASRGKERGEATVYELQNLGATALFVPTDVAEATAVASLFRTIVERFGRLDCAFNNAGNLEAGTAKPTAELLEEEFDQHMAANLKSVWLCLKHELTQMLSQGGGAIVNTSSINGFGGVPGDALYATAKAGVLALTKSTALEYAQHGIRVNALVPGGVRTPMLEGTFERLSPGDPEAAEAGFSQMVPLARVGKPEEAAEAVLWLCSDAASYVTGHSLIVDGGVTAPYR